MTSKEFYVASHRAPYLDPDRIPYHSNNVTTASSRGSSTAILTNRASSYGSLPLMRVVSGGGTSRKDEADSAAGGGTMATRVGSFLNIQQIQSENALLSSVGANYSANVDYSITRSCDNLNRSSGRGGGDRDDVTDESIDGKSAIKPDWRLRDRMRTVGVGLVMALNPGTDPPDVTKPNPCAVLQCWTDPRTISRSAAKGLIVERLEEQYAKWQLARTGKPLKYRKALDPTVDDVRDLCIQLRRQARTERILLHYNGHGVPRPTVNGEVWVFDKKHREYIPLAVADLRQWLGVPSIVVLDCSSAGILIPFWIGPLSDNPQPYPPPPRKPDGTIDMEEQSGQWVRETIVLCACSEGEWIPMNPEYPADVFTSCLTTPIKIALRWFVRRNQSMASLDPEAVDSIPGKANDRKTPLGELNWIFTATTDSIAWNVLPKPLFQRLFRQDLLVASMFRNFLLADRIMRTMGCTPVSHPPLPPGIAQHPLWQAWDLACETMLFQLIADGVLDTSQRPSMTPSSQQQDDDNEGSENGGNDPAPPRPPVMLQPQTSSNISSPFFSEQLTAFEVWLSFSEIHKMRLAQGDLEPPEQLPVVLQVLLSPVLRVRALGLLRRFLELGHWAVNLSLSLGIFPYVMKMLQSAEYKNLLVSIWASILAFDSSCRVDLLKEGAFHHFIQHLMWGLNGPMTGVSEAAKERTLAAFVLSAACHEYPAGQAECARLNLHGNCCALLSSYESSEQGNDATGAADLHLPAHFRQWLCICLGNMAKDNAPTQNEAYTSGVHTHLFARLGDKNAEVRAAACYALGCLVGAKPKQGSRSPSTQDLPSLASNALPGGIAPQRPQHFNPGSLVLQPPGGAPLPNFPSPGAIPNLNWNSSQVPRMSAQPVHFQQEQQTPLHFLGQPVQMQQTMIQHQYVMPGQQMPGPMGSPSGFLVGGTPLASQGQPMFSTGVFHQSPPIEPRQLRPSVFEDQQRILLDCQVMEHVSAMAKDASVVVRYEATVALGRMVGKYLDGFVVVADSAASSSSPRNDVKFPVPRGLERRTLDKFRVGWAVLRSLQHEDPFPAVAEAANDIVSVVHEVVLKFKLNAENEGFSGSEKAEDNMEFHTKKLASILAGIDENNYLGSSGTDSSKSKTQSSSSGQKKEASELRRVASEIATGHSSLEHAAKSLATGSQGAGYAVTPTNYMLPESFFYRWKKKSFDIAFKSPERQAGEIDPLSPSGAARTYRENRKRAAVRQGDEIARHFSPLNPKPPPPAKKTIEMILEEEAEEDEDVVEEVSKRRKELRFKEQRVLRINLQQTSILNFHSYEDYLVACCGSSHVSLWETCRGEKRVELENGNPPSTKITTTAWINEDSSSLFLTGCDDGTVRLWGDLIGASRPTLVSSFHATSSQLGRSGLICEWQQFSGHLLVGGNSQTVKCWDLEAEKELVEVPTDAAKDACVTTLTTAWDYDALGMGPSPHKCMGRDIFVAGMSNGTIKVFDLRSHCSGSTLLPKQRRTRYPAYVEHKSWVVSTSYTGYGGRFELISGSTSGAIKVWDLRMSSSIRTIEAQRSVMTALAVHPKIPVVATGSGAQFIKFLTLDGETLQAVRNHEVMSNYRIGPVSCLAFHKFKLLLAAGSTDNFIGLYKPNP